MARTRILAIAFGAALGAAATPGAVPAAGADALPAAVIVFDGSGSMWGKLEGDPAPKHQQAREALRNALPEIPANASVGLVSFGHRRKGDCSDVELMVPPEGRDVDRLIQPLEKLNPKGKGPLVAALREAATLLAGKPRASLVVIHDGPDNCQQDACAAAADIAKTQPGLAVHTVSIGLDPEDARKTSCIATATGGKSFDVRDAAGLAPALTDALRAAALDTARPKAAAPSPAPGAAKPAPREESRPALASPGLEVAAVLAEGGPPVTLPVRWRVMAGEGNGPALVEANGATLLAPLAPGTYTVEARLGLATQRKSLTVEAGPPKPALLVLSAGVVTPAARLRADGELMEDALYTISDASVAASRGKDAGPGGKALWMGRGGAGDIVLPTGTYLVRAEHGLVRRERTVEVTPGSRTAAELVMGSGRLELSAVLAEGGAPVTTITFVISVDDPDAPQGRREVTRSAAPRPEFVLPAGTYYASARIGDTEVRQRIAVSAGDIVKRTLALGLARLEIAADPGPSAEGAAVISRIVRADGGNEEARSGGRDAVFLLPAGRYRIESRLGLQNVRTERAVDLKSGESQRVQVTLAAAAISLKLKDGAPSGPDLYWEVRDEGGRVVWRTTQSEARMLLSPGRYTARAEARDKRHELAFEVRAGESKALTVGPQ